MYFLRSSEEREALISFLRTLEGAVKWACTHDGRGQGRPSAPPRCMRWPSTLRVRRLELLTAGLNFILLPYSRKAERGRWERGAGT